MAVDNPSILPDPPPPRPARRDAAIDAAMRRFDGISEPSASSRRPTRDGGWLQRPQFRLALTASLIAAIGLPAALIAVREGQFGPAQEAASQPVVAEAAPSGDGLATASEPAERRRLAPAGQAPPALTQPKQETPKAPDEAGELADMAPPVASAPPPAPLAAPAPPPPPPSAAARELRAEKAQTSDQDIMVTGSRLRRPNLESSAPVQVIGDARRNASPDWVREDRAYRTFLRQLQSAVRDEDRAAVLRLVDFPLRVNSGGRSRTYRNARAALDDYDRIFTPGVREAILRQRFEQLFGSDQGVMIGDGAVWFDHTCRNSQCSPAGPVRVRAINN